MALPDSCSKCEHYVSTDYCVIPDEDCAISNYDLNSGWEMGTTARTHVHPLCPLRKNVE